MTPAELEACKKALPYLVALSLDALHDGQFSYRTVKLTQDVLEYLDKYLDKRLEVKSG